MRTALISVSLLFLPTLALAQRLPEGAAPEHYVLTFTPDFSTDTFAGEEVIDIQLARPTRTITLNSAEITFTSAEVVVKKEKLPAQVSTDEKRQMATLAVNRELPAGPVQAHIVFKGTLNSKLRGFYLSRYQDRKYAVTQFESTDARRAFPCFDEPDKKATFDITIIAPKGNTAISNERLVSDTPGPGEEQHTLKFARTARLSSYLIALLVGDFQCISGEADGTPIRGCAVPEQVQYSRYAVTAAEHFLAYYNKYFGIKYPYSKLDMIALPDFEAGAMENAGAITYRDTAMLLDDATASVGAHENAALVVAHEMAHQWFGDLVTMKWWDNVWLNEGFATWMETKAVADWHPEWKVDLDEVAGMQGTLNLDALNTTRPIRTQAETPQEINELFDGIAYDKAGAVLRMVEHYLGPETFRKGVNSYLSAHVQGNATAEDFWNAMTKVSGKPVDKIMNSFVVQPGAPMVKAALKGNLLTLSQERFFFDRSMMGSVPNQVWSIPVCVRVAANTAQECIVFDRKTQTFPLKSATGSIYINADGRGFYRSEYEPDSRAALARQAETRLSPGERIAFLGDQWALVRIGRTPVGEYLEGYNGLRGELSRPVLDEMLNRINYIGERLVTPPAQPAFQRWTQSLLGPVLDDVSRKQHPTDEERSLKASLIATLGRIGKDPAVIAEAHKITSQYLRAASSVDTEVAGAALRVAAENGDEALYHEFVAAIDTAKTPQEHDRFMFGLANFTDPELVKTTLEYAVSGKVRNQNSADLIARVLGNVRNRDAAWRFVTSNWNRIVAQTTMSSGGGIVGASGSFCEASKADEVKEFFTTHTVASSERTLRQTLERIHTCSDLRSLQETNLANWLSQNPTTRAAD